VAAVLTMVAAEQGISLLPASISRLVHPGVLFKKIKDADLAFEHAFAVRVGETSPLVSGFLQLLHPE
jgi:hypothetical protein